ncbi:aminotransferase class IV [Planctomicrobium sp. SH664]|uniref:aminotransferase class IV n=1 Tax=Planctomicrobium sp. SH664 TaxID=3448125 RepID=UPI003F5BEF85
MNADSPSLPVVVLNGKLLPFTEARLPIYDLGIVQGATLTERLRTVRHEPFQVAEHLDRLEHSLRFVGWKSPATREELATAIQHVTRQNSRLIDRHSDLSVVVFMTAGQALGDANGCCSQSAPSWCVYTSPLPLSQWGAAHRQGLHLVIPSIRSLPASTLDPRIKMRSRLHWLLADQEAQHVAPGAAALLLDQEGFVTETSTGNLFVVRQGQLWTPAVEKTLAGISQAEFIGLAAASGIKCHRADLRPEDLAAAEEVFLTSSTYCLLPVTRLNGAMIGGSNPRHVTEELIRYWQRKHNFDFRQQALDALKSQEA